MSRYFRDENDEVDPLDSHELSTLEVPIPRSAFGDWRDRFLNLLWQGFSVVKAARTVGITRNSLYRIRKDSAEFAEQWQLVNESREACMIQQADDEMYRRHVEGYEKAVTWQGKVTDSYIERDTTAGKAWLAAHDARYRNAEQSNGPVRVVLHLDGMGLVAPTQPLETGGGGSGILDVQGSVQKDPEIDGATGEEEPCSKSPKNEGGGCV